MTPKASAPEAARPRQQRPAATVATNVEAQCQDEDCDWSGENAAESRKPIERGKAHAAASGHRVIVAFLLEPWS